MIMRALKENVPYHCIRFLLFSINLILDLAGFLILAAGLSSLFSRENGVFPPSDRGISGFPEILTGYGASIALISILGTFSVAQESQHILLTHMIMLLILCAFELVIGTIMYIKIDDITLNIITGMMTGLLQYHQNPDIQQGWDAMQRIGQCCGVKSRNDWTEVYEQIQNLSTNPNFSDNSSPNSIPNATNLNTLFFTCDGYNVPISCKDQNDGCYDMGCYNVGYEFVAIRIVPIGICIMAIFMLQLLALLMAVILYGLKKLRLASRVSGYNDTLLNRRDKTYDEQDLAY